MFIINNKTNMNQDSKREYETKGYTSFNKFLDIETINEMNKIIDNLDLKPSETVFDESGTGKIKQIQYLYNYDQIFIDLIEKLKPLATELIGTSEYDILNMQLFEKHPEISKPTRAHQDNAYFKVTPATAITFWLALDNIDENNGALYYAPYTHITPTRNHARYHPQTTFRIRSGVPGLSLCLHEHPSETDEIMRVHAGDLLVHNCNTIHRAGKNNTKDRRRRAIGIVFIPKKCKTDDRLLNHHNNMLKQDIELQKIKNPELYKKLREQFNYLFE